MNYEQLLFFTGAVTVTTFLLLIMPVIIKIIFPKKKKKEPEDIWGEDLTFPKCDWQYEVMNNDTVLGYWEWVEHQKEENSELENKNEKIQ